MLRRSYRRRHRDATADEIEELRAIRDDLGSVNTPESIDTTRYGVDRSERAPFEAAGWRFVETGRATAKATQDPRLSLARVLRLPGGRLALSSGRVTAKFKENVSQESIEQLLEPFALERLEPLPIATHLYTLQVRSSSSPDEFELAATLSQADDVEFAEPELIEDIGDR